MRHFLHKNLLFFLLLLGVASALLFFLSATHRFLPSPMYYADQFQQAFDRGDAERLALGNSKMLASILPDVLDSSIGDGGQTAMLAAMSADMRTSSLILEHYLDQCSNEPGVVILEVSWFSFNTSRTGLHKISGSLFLQDPWHGRELLLSKGVRSHIAQAVQDQLRAKVRVPRPQWFRKDYAWNTAQKTIPFDTAHFELLFPGDTAGVDMEQYTAFQAILELCSIRKIPVILYTAPEQEVFVRMQKDRADVLHHFVQAAQDPLVSYLDFSWGAPYYQAEFDDWFLDSHHLHRSAEFTRILGNMLRRSSQVYPVIQ